MTYTEKFTWAGKELIVKRETSPVNVVSAESAQIKLEKINVNDPSLRPSNYARAEGTVLPIFEAEGVRLDLSKRTKEPMSSSQSMLRCQKFIGSLVRLERSRRTPSASKMGRTVPSALA